MGWSPAIEFSDEASQSPRTRPSKGVKAMSREYGEIKALEP